MSTTLATVNPEAAARLADSRPLPGVGEWVIYYPRSGEVQRGRKRLPALVMAVDESNRLLELVIIRGANDVLEQDRIPERMGEDRGWERMAAIATGLPEDAPMTFNHAPQEVAALREGMDSLRNLILGGYEQPDKSVLELVDALDERTDRLERAIHDQVQASLAPKPRDKPGPKPKVKKK